MAVGAAVEQPPGAGLANGSQISHQGKGCVDVHFLFFLVVFCRRSQLKKKKKKQAVGKEWDAKSIRRKRSD